MKQDIVDELGLRGLLDESGAAESRCVINDVLREGLQRIVQLMLEAEVAAYIEALEEERDAKTGHRKVVRNGHLPERAFQTGVGSVKIRKPRVNDRREGHAFESAIVPSYMRRCPQLEELIPLLYLHGISTNDFPRVLSGILGEQALGLSPSTIVRLKESWEQEHETWRNRSLSGKRYVYFWVDGIRFNVRLNRDQPCILVIVGALEDGRKEIVALEDGERESALSWMAVLRDLKKRGLEEDPLLCIGDGALGFWKAMSEILPGARRQRCWVHKTKNVLDKLPTRAQPNAKRLLLDMYMEATKEDALKAYEEFGKLYGVKYPKAWKCLQEDKEDLFTFYDFPAEHWIHIRTTNPIESTFATIRHRTRQTKGCGSRKATLTMVFKLAEAAQQRWRRLNGSAQIPKIISGVVFKDGLEVADAA